MTDAYTNDLLAGDVSVGDTGPELVVEDVERQDFVRYAGASGDFNPIHYAEPYAKEAGNSSVFGQGMCTAGYAAHMVSDWFGLENVRTFEVRFQARVWPGDTITVSGEVTDITRSETTVVEAEITVQNDDNEIIITGTTTATLSSED